MVTEASGGGAFRSLRQRNFRLYFIGQGISTAGTFMQGVGQSWLVLDLTGSGTALGVVTMLQYLPLLLLGAQAGVILDRVDRRRLYMGTQAAAGLLAAILAVLTITESVELWMVYCLAGALGLITVIDQPIRQTFVYDLVGPDDLSNAVSLQVSLSATARAIGPAVAGLVIAGVGIGQCFVVNAISYAVAIVTLVFIRRDDMHVSEPQPRAPGQFRAGLQYVWRTPEVLATLVLTALFMGLAWEFEVAVPLVAKYTFNGGAGLYGLMTSAIGVGAIMAGLFMARRATISPTALVMAALAMSGAMLAGALAPTLWLEMLAMLGIGMGSAGLASAVSSRVQLASAPEMRGRVMALWAVAAVGMRPVGGPIVGFVGQQFGARASLLIGSVGVLFGLACWHLIRRSGRARHTVTEPAVA